MAHIAYLVVNVSHVGTCHITIGSQRGYIIKSGLLALLAQRVGPPALFAPATSTLVSPKNMFYKLICFNNLLRYCGMSVKISN